MIFLEEKSLLIEMTTASALLSLLLAKIFNLGCDLYISWRTLLKLKTLVELNEMS